MDLPKDDVTARPEECSTEDLGQKGKESADKDLSTSPSQKHLVIPKVARRLSARNAKRKLVSMRETTKLKAKKQKQSFSSDDDFVLREWDRPDSSSEDESEDSDSTTEAPHKCHICSRFYKHYKSLKYHLKTHSKRPFKHQCQTCDAAFAQKVDLEKHMRTHDGSRPYKCEECDSRFTQSSALKRHERIHAKVKPFSLQAHLVHCLSHRSPP
ncbi:KRAB [Acanthosepion pharaonis]|uniref:KRAB n=1 Tax=Acanthosepion pharaonis TaxID=158019 RepID=A0A812CSW0_ACAPH|nr:KRAB [Sepia pharaonis]